MHSHLQRKLRFPEKQNNRSVTTVTYNCNSNAFPRQTIYSYTNIHEHFDIKCRANADST